MKRDYDHLFKLVLIGKERSGKTCLLLRFADDAFTDSYITTIGVDFRFKTIPLDDKTIKLQAWDTAGEERFRSIRTAYCRGADAFLLVYDICDQESFAQIDTQIVELDQYASESTCKILIGTKCDLASERQVSADEAKKKAAALGIPFIETSAKDAMNVDEAFKLICSELIRVREGRIVVKLHATPRSVGEVALTCTNMGGDELAVFDIEDPRVKELQSLRATLAEYLKVSGVSLQFCLADGEQISNAKQNIPKLLGVASSLDAGEGGIAKSDRSVVSTHAGEATDATHSVAGYPADNKERL